eukprot:TRINITY_DN5684_c0_g1_i2.p1 TRINITY_DN5684_c0_g1~~TRINITY_DN5684_c0_g1_i2.p1  ORF type:complete len:974 (+),score=313.13 TRINITY_DN5684_c0_g1_i2:63-2924(+)
MEKEEAEQELKGKEAGCENAAEELENDSEWACITSGDLSKLFMTWHFLAEFGEEFVDRRFGLADVVNMLAPVPTLRYLQMAATIHSRLLQEISKVRDSDNTYEGIYKQLTVLPDDDIAVWEITMKGVLYISEQHYSSDASECAARAASLLGRRDYGQLPPRARLTLLSYLCNELSSTSRFRNYLENVMQLIEMHKNEAKKKKAAVAKKGKAPQETEQLSLLDPTRTMKREELAQLKKQQKQATQKEKETEKPGVDSNDHGGKLGNVLRPQLLGYDRKNNAYRLFDGRYVIVANESCTNWYLYPSSDMLKALLDSLTSKHAWETILRKNLAALLPSLSQQLSSETLDLWHNIDIDCKTLPLTNLIVTDDSAATAGETAADGSNKKSGAEEEAKDDDEEAGKKPDIGPMVVNCLRLGECKLKLLGIEEPMELEHFKTLIKQQEQPDATPVTDVAAADTSSASKDNADTPSPADDCKETKKSNSGADNEEEEAALELRREAWRAGVCAATTVGELTRQLRRLIARTAPTAYTASWKNRQKDCREALLACHTPAKLMLLLREYEPECRWIRCCAECYRRDRPRQMITCTRCDQAHHRACLRLDADQQAPPSAVALRRGAVWYCATCHPLVEEEKNEQSHDRCSRCGKQGRFICCESCPRVYHLRCVGLCRYPPGDWFCPDCVNKPRATRSASRRGSVAAALKDDLHASPVTPAAKQRRTSDEDSDDKGKDKPRKGGKKQASSEEDEASSKYSMRSRRRCTSSDSLGGEDSGGKDGEHEKEKQEGEGEKKGGAKDAAASGCTPASGDTAKKGSGDGGEDAGRESGEDVEKLKKEEKEEKEEGSDFEPGGGNAGEEDDGEPDAGEVQESSDSDFTSAGRHTTRNTGRTKAVAKGDKKKKSAPRQATRQRSRRPVAKDDDSSASSSGGNKEPGDSDSDFEGPRTRRKAAVRKPAGKRRRT